MITNFKDFSTWEQATSDVIVTRRIYIQMTGDIVSAILLGAIVYWSRPNKEGRTKLRVQKNDHFWIAKSKAEWWEEIGTSRREFDHACSKLESKGLIERRTYKFNNRPVLHIRLIEEPF